MIRIYKIKKAPFIVDLYFTRNFNNCTFNYYWYKGINGKTYGCEVMKEGKLYHNASQGTETDFFNMSIPL